VKIYTKTGDQGTTGLLNGTRVPKHHIRLDAYGSTDELNSWLGLIRDELGPHHPEAQFIPEIQEAIFSMGSHLAVEPGKANFPMPEINVALIEQMENRMDLMNEKLPPLRNFVLPGGHPIVSQIHIARTVCRRAERCVSLLNHHEAVPSEILRFLNRLSDYLFVLSRLISNEKEAKETPWRPQKKDS
jgi:cob(I)alamin adenosyltransferase